MVLSMLALAFVALTANARTQVESPVVSAVKVKQDACKIFTKDEADALFKRWNDSLKWKEKKKELKEAAALVVANYATHSILLPTVSNIPRLTEAEKRDYFEHFLKTDPDGRIVEEDKRFIETGCNTGVDAGLYTFNMLVGVERVDVPARYSFTYTYDMKSGQWLITSHHSSGMPEKL